MKLLLAILIVCACTVAAYFYLAPASRQPIYYYELGYKQGFIQCQMQTQRGMKLWKTDSGYNFNIDYSQQDTIRLMDSVAFERRLERSR